MSEKSNQLTAWLRARGATVHPSLELFGRCSSGEHGVFALTPIAAGDVLLSLPRSAVFTACESESCDSMPDTARGFPPVLRTALALLRERAAGESPWAEYLSCDAPEAGESSTGR